MSDNSFVIRQLVDVLQQGIDLIEKIDDDAYAVAPHPLASSGVGPHVRHVVDFVDRFVEMAPSGRVNYDLRARDGRTEVDRRAAITRLRSACSSLLPLAELDVSRPLRVRMDVPDGVPEGEGWTTSTVARELSFLLSHTVHHYAVLAVLLRSRGIDPGPEFGVAPSTLAYWSEAGPAPLAG